MTFETRREMRCNMHGGSTGCQMACPTQAEVSAPIWVSIGCGCRCGSGSTICGCAVYELMTGMVDLERWTSRRVPVLEGLNLKNKF
jgi:hypothetical protein